MVSQCIIISSHSFAYRSVLVIPDGYPSIFSQTIIPFLSLTKISYSSRCLRQHFRSTVPPRTLKPDPDLTSKSFIFGTMIDSFLRGSLRVLYYTAISGITNPFATAIINVKGFSLVQWIVMLLTQQMRYQVRNSTRFQRRTEQDETWEIIHEEKRLARKRDTSSVRTERKKNETNKKTSANKTQRIEERRKSDTTRCIQGQ